MVWFVRLLLLAILVFALALTGLYFYGASLKPQTAPVEKVIPNDRFPQ
jgi:hypothetical protein